MAESGFQFQCPECKALIETNDREVGGKVLCAACGKIVKAPEGRLAPGAVFGDFLIERELGSGGMGKVFLAHQLSLDRPAAIKILKPEFSNESDSVHGFIREARSAAKINHPNIVQAYAVGKLDGLFYFAMEYVDGRTMKEVLAERRRIQFDEAAKMIMQVADALDTAWKEQKLIHHDIKPDNMLLCENDRIKLSDLGLASGFGEDADDDSTEVLGTPQYISPEQLTGVVTDTRSDIYSLGATFYHLVTGQFPYTGENVDEIAKQHVYGTLTPPRQVYPMLPEDLNQIIIKMMAKNPEDRFQNCSEVVAAIKKHFSGSSGMSGGLQSAANTGLGNQLSAPGKLQGGLSGSGSSGQGLSGGGLSNGGGLSGGGLSSTPVTSIQPKLQPSSGKLKIGIKKAEEPKPASAADTSAPAAAEQPAADAGKKKPLKIKTPEPPAASEQPAADAPAVTALSSSETAEAVIASMTARATSDEKNKKKSPNLWIILIAGGVLLLGGLGAAGYFFRDRIPFLKNLFQASAKAEKSAVPEARPQQSPPKPQPPPPPVSVAPAAPRKLQIPVVTAPAPVPTATAAKADDRFLQEIRSLLNQRGNEAEFVKKAEAFLQQHPTATGFKEAQALNELRNAYVAADEKSVIAPARKKLIDQEKQRRKAQIAEQEKQARFAALAASELQRKKDALITQEAYRDYLESLQCKLDYLFLEAAESGDPKAFQLALTVAEKEPERVASYRGYSALAKHLLTDYSRKLSQAYAYGEQIDKILKQGSEKLQNLRVAYYPNTYGTITKVGNGVITITPEADGAAPLEWRPEIQNEAYARLLFSSINEALQRRNLYFYYMLFNHQFGVDFREDAPDRFWFDRVPRIGIHYFYWKLKLATPSDTAALQQQYGNLELFKMAAARLQKERMAEARKAAQ